MHHFIYSTKDSWISSGSNHTTGVTETDQNYGQDSIIELKKNFWNLSFDYPNIGTRIAQLMDEAHTPSDLFVFPGDAP